VVGGRALGEFGHTHTLAGNSEPVAKSGNGVSRRPNCAGGVGGEPRGLFS
jgi:hypothetical protein